MAIDGSSVRGIGLIANVASSVQYFEHPLGGSLRLPDLCEHACGGTEGADQNSGKEDECKEVARRNASINDLPSPIPQHRRRRGEGQEADDGNKHRHDAGLAHRQCQRLFNLRGKPGFFSLCLNEGLHDPDAGDHFFDQGAHCCGVILNRGREGFQPSSEDLGHENEQWEQNQDQEAEPPIHHQQERDSSDEGHELF